MSSAADDPERRHDTRGPIELRVEYKRLNTFFADYTKNISRGGSFIATDRPLDVGTEFIFALDLPGLPEPLRIKGRVMWITHPDEASKANPAGMGIEFQYANDAERRDMERVVEGLIFAQLGEHLGHKLLGRG